MVVRNLTSAVVSPFCRGVDVKAVEPVGLEQPAEFRVATNSLQGFPLPSVSVCIPVFNSEDTIARSITSVLDQSYQDFECVVVDNHSTDSTVDKVKEFKDERIRIVQNQSNIGMVGNHNECLRQARGELLQFVHGDDWLLPNCLERLVVTFEDPAVGLAFAPRHVETTDYAWKTRYGQLHTVLEPLSAVNSGRELVKRYLAAGGNGNPIGEPTCVMVRRDVLRAVGGFRPEVPQLQDVDAWLRVLARSKSAWVNEPLSVRWHHGGSETDVHRSPGSELFDKMWIMSSLALNDDLDRQTRLRALALWTKVFVRSSRALALAPRTQRAHIARQLSSHVGKVAARNRPTFCTD
jgi:glycosyltransferase involved in cell wall biosynthesis